MLGAGQMFGIAETARNEAGHLKRELRKIRDDIEKIINEFDQCEVKKKASWRRLAHVSMDFKICRG